MGSRMTNKEYPKVVINILVNIVLFIIYALLFGQQSVKKYLEKGVAIVRYTECRTEMGVWQDRNGSLA